MTGWSAEARAAAAKARAAKAKNKVKLAQKNASKQTLGPGQKHLVVASQLKRAGDASYAKAGGTSKPHYRGGKVFGLATKVSVSSLKETLHRVATGNPKSGYKAATIVTQKGSFQSSIGKNVFHGGSRASLALNRGSIGKGFEMKAVTHPVTQNASKGTPHLLKAPQRTKATAKK